MRRRGRIWWYRRFRRAYRKHGVTLSRRATWADAMWARRGMPVEAQRKLRRIS